MCANWYGTDYDFVQDLVKGGVFGAAYVDYFPLHILVEWGCAFECYFELEGVEECGWVVQYILLEQWMGIG